MNNLSIYQEIYDLIVQYVFGGQTLNNFQELATTLISLTSCIFLISLPFLIVWRIIKLFLH